ncbi:MAG: MFS transporter [Verrucomicrobia bacterium]|nr:MFS transporter [Verrucomicrobiota bacterium]
MKLSKMVEDLRIGLAETRLLSRAVWLLIAAFTVDAIAYFGFLTLMTEYLSSNIGWGDKWSGWGVSLFTMSVTLFMLGAGTIAEGFGLRKAVLASLLIATVGRAAYSYAPNLAGLATMVVIVSLVLTALGEAMLQPVVYSGVKQFTDERSNAIGYSMIYAWMNLGVMASAPISSWIRPAVQAVKDAPPGAPAQSSGFIAWLASLTGSGVQAVNWTFTFVTFLAFVGFYFGFRKRDEAARLRPDPVSETIDPRPLGERIRSYFADGPFTNARFMFFIFMLLPVRTLFAHQWLTMPQYILRAFGPEVQDRMEYLVNWTNPGIIFIFVPLFAALTRRVHVFHIMVIGSLVSAVPTFLLCAGPSLPLLVTYLVIFSLGEALWNSRFLEYASELAPPGKVSQYMGLANVPWLLAKGTTGMYSGYLLSQYCPDKIPVEQLQTGKLWFIYGCIAMLSPVGLWLARHWVMGGFASEAEKKAV